MQRISIKNLKPGMYLGRSIYDSNGHLLLYKGALLTDSYIRKLRHLSIPAIYIENSALLDLEIPEDIINEKIRVKSIKIVANIFKKCQLSDNIDTNIIFHTTEQIIKEIMHNRDNLVQMSAIRTYDDYTFSHSVNVCALSVMVGILLDYKLDALIELATGALLHDIGKIKLPKTILNKESILTAEEFKIIERHPMLGFDLLRHNTSYSLLSMRIALDHHEKIDGTGYPRGLKGKNIHEYARIVAITDVYDALTADRIYKPACRPHEAYETMMNEGADHFDVDLLELFFSNIAIYPVGIGIELTSGHYAIVIKAEKNHTTTPTVKVIATGLEELMTPPITLDLSQPNTPSILRVLNEEELLNLLDKVNLYRIKNQTEK